MTSLAGGSRVPFAGWATTSAVLSASHNLAGALDKVTPAVVAQPKHAAAVAGLKVSTRVAGGGKGGGKGGSGAVQALHARWLLCTPCRHLFSG